MLGKMLKEMQNTAPLVHNITNYVTVNDCANILIACGASPIMADEPEDVREITAICSALNINIGTLNKRTVEAMFEAGRISKALAHPILLDPVGAGASNYRTETAKKLIKELQPTVIRGNLSEIRALAEGVSSTRGVDASGTDTITLDNVDNIAGFAKSFAKETGAVVVITGAVDIAADARTSYIITNGHPMMSKISGTGCMLSAMTAAYIAANPASVTEAAAASVCAMGLCGERAFERLKADEGNLTFKNRIFDEIYNLTPEILDEGARYEIR